MRLARTGRCAILRQQQYVIEGKPVPKGSRVQGFSSKTGRSYSREANKHVGPWMKSAHGQVLAQHEGGQLKEPYRVTCTFFFEPPQQRSWPRSGDCEKYLRAVADVLQGGGTYGTGVISDDRHIIEISGKKVYAEDGTPARTVVLVEEVNGI